MNATSRTLDALGEPDKFGRARDCFIDAIEALRRGHLNDAIQAANNGRLLLEVEQQFRDARSRRGG